MHVQLGRNVGLDGAQKGEELLTAMADAARRSPDRSPYQMSAADGLKLGSHPTHAMITVRACNRTLKRLGARRGHIASVPKEDGHVQTLR